MNKADSSVRSSLSLSSSLSIKISVAIHRVQCPPCAEMRDSRIQDSAGRENRRFPTHSVGVAGRRSRGEGAAGERLAAPALLRSRSRRGVRGGDQRRRCDLHHQERIVLPSQRESERKKREKEVDVEWEEKNSPRALESSSLLSTPLSPTLIPPPSLLSFQKTEQPQKQPCPQSRCVFSSSFFSFLAISRERDSSALPAGAIDGQMEAAQHLRDAQKGRVEENRRHRRDHRRLLLFKLLASGLRFDQTLHFAPLPTSPKPVWTSFTFSRGGWIRANGSDGERGAGGKLFGVADAADDDEAGRSSPPLPSRLDRLVPALLLFLVSLSGRTALALRWRRLSWLEGSPRESYAAKSLSSSLLVFRRDGEAGKNQLASTCFFQRLLSRSHSLSHMLSERKNATQKNTTTQTAPSLPPLRRDRMDRGPPQRAPHQGGRDLAGVQGAPRGPRADPEGD